MTGRTPRLLQGLFAFAAAVISFDVLRAEDPEQHVLPLLKKHCLTCHDSQSQKGSLDLERFLNQPKIAREIKIWRAVGELVSKGEMPPSDQPEPANKLRDDERTLITTCVSRLIQEIESAEPTDPGPSFPRRITRREYRNATRDLFNFEADVDTYLPEQRSISGYDNQIGQLTFPPELLEKFLMLAESVVEGASWNMDNTRDKEPVSRWNKVREGENGLKAREAAEQNLKLLARLAFRRPPDDDEVEMLLKPFDRSMAVRKDYYRSQRYAIKALLVMPQFLYRTEAMPVDERAAPVEDYELAGRLAAFLWSSIPDPELLDLAAAGKLHEPDVLRQQVRRMMHDPRIARLAAEFPEQWLFGRQQTHAIDQVMFPEFTPGLAKASSDELALCFEKLIKEQRSLIELLDADYTFVNEDLAALYGMKDVREPKMRQVQLTDRRRGGLLGMAIMHQKTSMPSRTSPTNRGKWVLDSLLGSPPPPPPPDINNTVDKGAQDPEGRPLSLREKLDLHGQQGSSCANCHLKMDPLGYALENYNPIGQFRETDGNAPVHNSGRLPDGTELKGMESLKQVLLQRKDKFVETVIQQLLTYALGRDLQSYDQPTIRRVTDAVKAKQYRADVLVEEIALSYPFLHKRAPRPDEIPGGREEKSP